MEEITCPVCGATQWATADCFACGHPLDEGDEEDGAHAGEDESPW